MHAKRKTYLYQLAIFSFILAGVMLLTNPYEVNIGFLLVPMVLVFLIIFSGLNLLFITISKVGAHARFISALILSCGLSLLVVLASVGSLSRYDVLVVFLITVLALVYAKKMSG